MPESPRKTATTPADTDSRRIKSLLEDELNRGEPFANFHGITPATVRSFLVEPFAVTVHPDDLQTQPRDMWVVLREMRIPTTGHVVVYDPVTRTRGVAEHSDDDDYILIVSAPSLAGALNGM